MPFCLEIARKRSAIQIPFAPQLKITVCQLDTHRYFIKNNNYYVIIFTGTVSLPASLLVVFLGKALNGMTPSVCGK